MILIGDIDENVIHCLVKSFADDNIPVDKFKNALDTYLKTVPDEPQIRGYTGCRRVDSNSILDMKSLC